VFGTSLAHDAVRWLYPSAWMRRLVECIPDNSDFQKLVWLSRMAKRICFDYDVLLTGDNEVDLGRPAIQYVHYPYLAVQEARMKQRRYRPWMAISAFSFQRMRRNLTLVNSKWTAGEFRNFYGVRAEVLHPPASGKYSEVPWEDRADEFVCVSRLEAVKNHLRMLEILRRVRVRHGQIRFRIIGTRSNNRSGAAYYQELRRAVDGNADWVELEGDVSRAELAQRLSHARYGIHLMPGEHFGMAVAEMLRAGMIPFVHNSGGQVEIADQPELLFQDDDEAVMRIDAVLSDAALRDRLRRGLEGRRMLFAPEHFCAELREWVERWRRAVTAKRQRDADKLYLMNETIGFAGLGIMGSGMVRNLAAKGHKVRIWNRTAAKAEALASTLGIEHAPTLRKLAEGSTILMLCVTNTEDVKQVLFGGEGAAQGLAKDSLVIDCSTISPKATEEIGAQLRERGIAFVDAPVSGGSEGAAQGTLSIMAGGAEADFARAQPVLQAIGTRITHMGGVGQGQVTKLLNQILVVVNMLAVSEA
jgi:3-hydroxyisobutyrate dehydrogenase and related beta-hydroxyacid dehydrogenases